MDHDARHLALLDLDRTGGCFAARVLDRWQVAGGELGTIGERTAAVVAPALEAGDVQVLDVRWSAEWSPAHHAGVLDPPTGYLLDQVA